MKHGIVIYLSFCFVLVTLCGCSSKLNPITVRTAQESNKHLKYEQDSLSNFLLYQGFVVQFNSEKKVPNYTIHRIVPCQLKDSNKLEARRSDDFGVDARISQYSATRADYFKSGYDRGHLVPAGDFIYSQALKDETFTYSNVSPQLKEVNRYGWKYLEMAIRKRVKRCNCEAYVITGAHFLENHKLIGFNKIGVPNQLYKIVFFPKRAKMYAFLMNNNTDRYLGKLKYYQVTVDELEEMLQIDFFEALEDKNENCLEREFKRFKG